MSVKFKTVAHKNLQDLAAPAKHYALVEPMGTTDIDGFSAIIAGQSTGSRPDVYLVIMGLLDAINQELADGRRVHLGKLGTFCLSVTSEGKETPQTVTASSIKKARIIYRPGAETRAMLKTIHYEKKS